MVKLGICLCIIGVVIQKYVEGEGFFVVCEYCGYGIGCGFYEELQVLYYDVDDGGVVLQSGMIFIIELMLNVGDYCICIMKDGWMVKIKDCSLFVQYEYIIVVMENGCEILMLCKDDIILVIIIYDE